MSVLANQQMRIWLAIVGVATLVIGGSYAMVQQSTRLSANDLPLTTNQLSKQQLQMGSEANEVIPALKTNLRQNDSLFVIITDETRHVLASSAEIDGQTPLPPQGVFSFTSQHQTDHFTWQPVDGVRLATYVSTYKNGSASGYIITGQSLKPYEDRVSVYTALSLAAWLASLAWSYLLIVLPGVRSK